jgi:hypothetical protein
MSEMARVDEAGVDDFRLRDLRPLQSAWMKLPLPGS